MGVIKFDKIKDSLLDYYENGGGKTFYVGFNGLANHYSIKEGGCTDWTGYPGSGKTELLLQVLINCSKWYKHKHLIHMPDAGSHEEVIAKLIHKWTGKQFEEFYYDKKGEKVEIKNRITEAEMFKVLPEIMDHFKIYNPDGENKTKSITPKEYWDYAVKEKSKLGIFSAVIDSWNYMNHDTEGYGREDKWLEYTLSYRNQLAENNDIHFHTIIHPKSAKKDKKGDIIMPDMHHLKGGSEWANNGKTIIIVHRGFGSPITDIRIDKAKPKIVGVQGLANLRLDLNYGGFYEMLNGKRFYSHEEPIILDKKVTVEHHNPNERIEGGSDDEDDLPF